MSKGLVNLPFSKSKKYIFLVFKMMYTQCKMNSYQLPNKSMERVHRGYHHVEITCPAECYIDNYIGLLNMNNKFYL